jgi:hypothetical protein
MVKKGTKLVEILARSSIFGFVQMQLLLQNGPLDCQNMRHIPLSGHYKTRVLPKYRCAKILGC